MMGMILFDSPDKYNKIVLEKVAISTIIIDILFN